MSELDQSIDAIENEQRSLGAKHVKIKPDVKRRRNPLLYVLIVVAVAAMFQMKAISSWILGVPEDTVQADIIALLESTDKDLQAQWNTSGDYPETLPADTPKWLIGYKKTLAGYKISTSIDDVEVELERRGENVTVQRVQ